MVFHITTVVLDDVVISLEGLVDASIGCCENARDLGLLAIDITTARLASACFAAFEYTGLSGAPCKPALHKDPLSPLSAVCIPGKSRFVKQASCPKTVLSLVPSLLPSATSNKVVVSAQVKPPAP